MPKAEHMNSVAEINVDRSHQNSLLPLFVGPPLSADGLIRQAILDRITSLNQRQIGLES